MAKLTPPDKERCQAEHTAGYSFMTFGGRPEDMVQCENKPTVIVVENEPGKDGQHGSMSLCDKCRVIFVEKMGEGYGTFKPIEYELMDKWAAACKVAQEAESAAWSVRHEIVKVMAERFGIDEYDCEIGSWNCGDSPIGICVYNKEEDPCNDDCLICHYPSERK